jgi:phosphate transport system substrate-binding protein
MWCAARTWSRRCAVAAGTAGLLILSLALVSCASIPTPIATSTPTAVPVLQLGFDEALRPLMHAAMPIYADEHPLAVVETRVAGTTPLMSALQEGRIAAAMIPGSATAEAGGWVSAIAIDGLAVVANPENQLTSLTMHQVQSIFQGRIWSWSDVGGADGQIEVVTWAPGSAMVGLLREQVLGDRSVTLTAVVMPDTDSVLDYVGSRPGAIGYVSAAAVNGRVKVLAVDGVYPTVQTLSDRTYPLYHPISFVATAEPQGPLRDFTSWLLSHDGQAVIGQIYGRVR